MSDDTERGSVPDSPNDDVIPGTWLAHNGDVVIAEVCPPGMVPARRGVLEANGWTSKPDGSLVRGTWLETVAAEIAALTPEQSAYVHHLAAHPLLDLVPTLGEWLHERTEP